MIRRENKISFDFGKEEEEEEEDGFGLIGSWASSNINNLVVGLLERRWKGDGQIGS
jgi:hypothetical protein